MITRSFEIHQFNHNTMRCDCLAELTIEGTDPNDCWEQAYQWCRENASKAATPVGVFTPEEAAEILKHSNLK